MRMTKPGALPQAIRTLPFQAQRASSLLDLYGKWGLFAEVAVDGADDAALNSWPESEISAIITLKTASRFHVFFYGRYFHHFDGMLSKVGCVEVASATVSA